MYVEFSSIGESDDCNYLTYVLSFLSFLHGYLIFFIINYVQTCTFEKQIIEKSKLKKIM